MQVYYNKTWAWVCADQWDKQDADVSCRMMGFNGSVSTGFETQKRKEIGLPVWMNNVQCFGNENSLFACDNDKRGWHKNCANVNIAWAKCSERKGELMFYQCVQCFSYF